MLISAIIIWPPSVRSFVLPVGEVKVEIQVIKPDALAHDARVCGLDAELLAVPQRVELDSSNAQAHLGVEDAREGLEVAEQHDEDEAAQVLSDERLVWAHVLEVERD